jgi:allantoinase
MKLFTNASLPTSSSAMKRVNLLFDEKILKISTDEIVAEEISEVVDLKGKVLLPGAVDAHCHIITGKDPAKSIARISKTALTGGWTTLAELSYLNPKPIFTLEDFKLMQDVISQHSFVDMALWGNVNIAAYPYHAETAQELWVAGVVGLALMNPSPNQAITALSFTEIMDLFMEIYESDTAFSFQGYDHEKHETDGFEAHRDAIKKILRRMQENPIHIPKISSFPTIEFINSISKRSDISFSLCISDLMSIYSGISPILPNEMEEFKDMLFDLLRTNKIYVLSNNIENNNLPENLSMAYRGTPEKQAQFSFLWLLSELWQKRKVPLATVLKMSSENPAKRLGIYPQKGCLEAGSDADFVIYDPDKTTSYKADDGTDLTLQGQIESVWLRGTRVIYKGKASPAAGGFLKRTATPKRRHNTTTWF